MKVPALILLFALGACVQCTAGTTGVMNGYVRDENGKAAANALVAVNSPSESNWTRTDKNGFFVFLDLPPDVYTVDVQKEGTSGAYAFNARINSDQTTFLHLLVSRYMRCGPSSNPVTLGAYQQSAPFYSLDVWQMNQYPPKMAPPIRDPLVLPLQRLKCL